MLEVKYDFQNESPFISEVYPKERIDILKFDNGESYKEILDDIVYFDLKLPRSSYQSTKVNIKFKNESQPFFDLAALTSEELWSFDTYTLENKFIDNSDWHKIQEEELVLLQKKNKFETIDQFLESINSKTRIAYYNYNKLPKVIEIDNYKKSDETLEINHALRGSHTFYTYIDNENLNFDFTYQDLNRADGEDLFKINIIKEKNGELIRQESKEDDGVNISSGNLSSDNTFNLNIPKLEKGVYKINLDLNEDIIIKNIKTKQKYIVFEKKMYLANSNEYLSDIDSEEKMAVDFFNTGSNLYIKTDHKNSLQKISINDQVLEIDSANKKFDYNTDILNENFNKIYSSKSDLLVESDGYFVFSKDNYFNPKPKNLIQLVDGLNLENFDFIIAKYNPNAEENNGWKNVSTEFDITKLHLDKNSKIKFRLSSPGLKDTESKIKISEISVLLEKDPMTFDKIFQKLKGE
ncbi:MAG: hypothetical protein HQ538_02620 [Parcubacteria group bacterium]|nr:hypothetical protein [Parcubacteria group bacterium]